MKYKAVISDIDGTLTEADQRDSKPSSQVVACVARLRDYGIPFCLATGRPPHMIDGIIRDLGGYVDYVISDNGAAIYDVKTEKLVWSAYLPHNDAQFFLKTARSLQLLVKMSCEHGGVVNFEKIDDAYLIKKISAHDIDHSVADEFINLLQSNLHDVSFSKASSYAGSIKIDVYMTHITATKQNAVYKLSQVLGISTKEMIGIGDHHNDFSLLMACGLGVAMGNAVPELKEIADYIAPSVADDGFVGVINKFILSDEN